MITATFMQDKKTLAKDDYIKEFAVNSLEELLSKIKVKEQIKIITDDVDLYYKLMFSENNYIVIFQKNKIDIFNEQTVTQDLTNLHNGNIKYLKYKPQDKWLKTLGETVYIVNDRQLQREIVDKQNCYAFLPSDLKELNEGLKKNGEIPPQLVLKMFFNGKEIQEIERSNIE